MIDPLIGQSLGPYVLTERIGAGGMGAVYRAVHETLDQPRAVKILPPGLGTDPAFVTRFVREARTAARLRHPNVVQVYDVGSQDGINYLVMELLEGRSLRDLHREEGPLPFARVIGILHQLASALDAAHSLGIVHRDVKPANAIVGTDDHLTLVDFGIARALEASGITGSALIGTPEYMAPELIRGEAPGPGVDQYALGIVAFELLAGRVPFRGESVPATMYGHVHESPPSPIDIRPDLQPQSGQVLLRQLLKSPEARYPTALAFIEALAGALSAPTNGSTRLVIETALSSLPDASTNEPLSDLARDSSQDQSKRSLNRTPATHRVSRRHVLSALGATGVAGVALSVAALLLREQKPDQSQADSGPVGPHQAATATINAPATNSLPPPPSLPTTGIASTGHPPSEPAGPRLEDRNPTANARGLPWPPPRGSVVGQAPAGKNFTLGIIQFVSHPALDSARKGTIDALADNGFKAGANLKIDFQNGQADVGTTNGVAQHFKGANLDLVVAIATPPYQAMLNVAKAEGKPPIIFSAIVEPFAASGGIVKSPTDKPPFVTGLQALPLVEDAMRIAQRCVPSARKFGLIWNPSEANSVVVTALAREATLKLGVELVEQTVSKQDDVLQAAQALVTRGIDLFFISTDSTVVANFEAVVKVAIDNKKPLFANDPSSAARGAAAALGIDYEQVGYESGQMAAMFLAGKPMSEIPVQKASQGLLAINTKAADLQGVMLPDDLVKQVKQTFNEIAVPRTASAQPQQSQSAASGGQIVLVRGTGGSGARLRSEPGNSGQILTVVTENTPLLIIGDERTVDGLIWRNVRAPDGNDGWIAAQFVGTSDNPIPAPATLRTTTTPVAPLAKPSQPTATVPTQPIPSASVPKRVNDVDRAYLGRLQAQIDALGKSITAANEQIERVGKQPELASDPVWRQDTQGVARSLSDAAERIRGLTPGPATGEAHHSARNAADRADVAASRLSSAVSTRDANGLKGVRTDLVAILSEINNVNLALLQLQ